MAWICMLCAAHGATRRALDLAAWVDASADAARLARLSSVRTIYAVTFALRPDGRLEALPAPALRAWLPDARARGARVLATVQNLGPAGFDPAPVRGWIADPARRAAHVADLVALVLGGDYDGLALDYEALGPEDAEAVSAFVEALGGALRERGRVLSVAVPARTAAPPPPHALAFDWARIGAAADEVVVMAYDHSWPGGPPGPVAPLDWVLEVARHARATLPPDRLRLALPLYGYDWGDATVPVPQRDLRRWITSRGGARARPAPVPRGAGRAYARSYLDPAGARRVVYGDGPDATLEKAAALGRAGVARLAFWRAEYAADGLFERLARRRATPARYTNEKTDVGSGR
jgi:hypothetical protein